MATALESPSFRRRYAERSSRATPPDIELCRRTIARHSKSFSLASRLLAASCRDDAVVLYAWCRAADDAVDLARPEDQARAVERLRAELASVYRGDSQSTAILATFQDVVARCRIPQEYPEELLCGMEMDVIHTRYETLQDLLLYCYRVAGIVGLMMCHVMGVRDRRALRHAAHLGMAMQLTNICRDVLEDWQRGRLYVPAEILASCGAAGLVDQLGRPLSRSYRASLGQAVESLLREADRFYRSGDEGTTLLDWRSALATRTARLVYARIGDRIARQRYDVFATRAYVPLVDKLQLALRAMARAPTDLLGELRQGFLRDRLTHVLRFPQDVLPV
ncbi:MAG: phytoene/squalene synthase family protein [Polyangiaceae bacterium]|nr:phytoene/squalene synthase family protein [Polyangiaceae bacterium]